MINVSNIVRIDMDSEGDVNCTFTVKFLDGTEQSGWSCDQGSIEWDDEDFEPSPALCQICFDAWFGMDLPEGDDERYYTHRFSATWTPADGLSATTATES